MSDHFFLHVRLRALCVCAHLAAILVGGCSKTQHCEVSHPRVHGPVFLWRVEKGSAPPSFVFGTIHDEGERGVPDVAWSALDGATTFVSELGDQEPDPAELAELARLPFGTALPQLLAQDDWFDLVDALRGVVDEDALKHAQPWWAMMRLTSHVGHSPRPSMDDALAAHAKHRGLPVEHLERWQDQLRALTASVDAKDLAEAIHARATMACALEQLRASYADADEPALTVALRVRTGSSLISARNAAWLPAIERFADRGGVFIAVGLGHLLGEDGLPQQLARDGYKVSRIP